MAYDVSGGTMLVVDDVGKLWSIRTSQPTLNSVIMDAIGTALQVQYQIETGED